MPKLATPVQYEPSLEGLNDIRPLQLADEGKIVVPCPALCQNPPTKDRPAIGRLARCTQQGALVKYNSRLYTAYETGFKPISFYGSLVSHTFAKRVKGVIAKAIIGTHTYTAVWSESTGTLSFADILFDVNVWLPFTGQTIWFKGTGEDLWAGWIGFWGFFK